jgi:syntaxin-binding protein 1
MAQECMGIFERDKLSDIASVQQVFVSLHLFSWLVILTSPQNCATGLTPEGKTPKNLVEEMVPLLDSREVV